jgi:CubicO group peptidase (beta-lactamase class C family)
MIHTHDEALEALRKKFNLPALAAVVVAEGKPQTVLVAGVRKAGGTDPALPTDAFHIGSDTKAMTAALVGLLVDEGKLGWKSTLGELVAETPTAWKATTIEALLAHRAGLTKDEPKGKNLLYMHRFTGPLEKQRARWYIERLATPPDETAGKYQYANAGYAILGMLVEKLAATPWERLIAERLWKPLGITGGGFGAPPLVWQHLREDKKLVAIDPKEKADNPPLMSPAGRVHLPIGEWGKFVAVFADPERQKLLKPETMKALTTPLLGGNYAGGWVVVQRSWAGGMVLNHAGSNTMNFCTTWVAPKKRLAVLVATNVADEDAQKACDAAVGVVLGPYLKG